MAERYGEPVDLWDEVLYYLSGLRYGAYISRWDINDFLDGCRGNEFSKSEFEAIISRLEKNYGISIPNGSLGGHITRVSPHELLTETAKEHERRAEGFTHMSKLDELELQAKRV